MRIFCLVVVFNFFLQNVISQDNSIYFLTSRNTADRENLDIYKDEKGNNDSVVVFKATIADEELLVKELAVEDIAGSDSTNFLFFINGYGRGLKDVVKRSVDIQNTYGVKVIAYYWSSLRKNGKPSNLKQANTIISDDFSNFVKVFDVAEYIKENFPGASINLIAHSLGNYYFEILGKNGNSIHYEKLFDNLILNSAAVEDLNHEDWLKNIEIQQNTYVVYNNYDYLLKGLQVFTRIKRPLGLKIKGEMSDSIHYLDFSNIVGKQHPYYRTHSYFSGDIVYEINGLRDKYFKLFNGLTL